MNRNSQPGRSWCHGGGANGPHVQPFLLEALCHCQCPLTFSQHYGDNGAGALQGIQPCLFEPLAEPISQQAHALSPLRFGIEQIQTCFHAIEKKRGDGRREYEGAAAVDQVLDDHLRSRHESTKEAKGFAEG